MLFLGYHRIDQRNQPHILIDEIGQPQGTKLLSDDLGASTRGLPLGHLGQSLQRPEVNLADHPGLAVDPGEFPDVVVGSSLFDFLV